MTGARPGKSSLLRNKELAKIHLLAKQLGMDRDTYEAMLYAQARVESAAHLDDFQRRAVIEHLQALVTRPRCVGDRKGGAPITHSSPSFGERPNNFGANQRAELSKIEALLADDGKPWSYALGMARRMYGKERMEFCGPAQLAGIIAALEKQALKRLAAQLEATLGAAWEDRAGRLGALLFGFDSLHRDITRNSQALSQVLRWLRGQLSVACVWPPVGAEGCVVMLDVRPHP